MHIKSVGFKDMAEEQIEELLNFCCHALNVATNYGDDDVATETEEKVAALIEIFGGHAIIDQTSPESSDSEQGSDLLERLLRGSWTARPETGSEGEK